ncbi:glycosyltransferase [Microbacterium sp. CFH 31415]|uniref:glycosyltransferase n=1 Tax=Microbacterium sp. CFH 31415 TaxID=2921732 RepID=UPI001F136ABD|nr:glycosyltransferase [Microbacterium sp. CFH 31415]MCH6231197.1 glycosyltransferase [Microbacterium sp. CFH 31415]
MTVRTPHLPHGRHFAVTWSIPDDFGGMTEAILRRSRAFSEVAGTPVDVLTFDARPDHPALAERLRQTGALSDGIRILNLYDWLREHELPEAAAPTPPVTVDAPIPEGAPSTARMRDGRVVSRMVRDGGGGMLQTDHFRADGTLLLTDRRDVRRRGTLGGRRLVLHDREGRPVRAWTRAWALYADWLDALTDHTPSYMIVDSKTIAPFMQTYRRPHVVSVHLIHGSHRDSAGAVKSSRRAALTSARHFDAVAVLSRTQARDLRRDVDGLPPVAVVANPRATHTGDAPIGPRDAASGIVVASLTKRKRVSHAIDAVVRANEGRSTPLTLDIFGDGESRGPLERRAAGHPEIRLHGHDPRARDRLAAASYAVFTPHSEGFPLALVEAMAAGCIPIAYDVDYGPGDIIHHGRNGFLVPRGDVAALARTVARVADLPEPSRQRIRERAVRSTSRFTDEAVCRQWAGVFGLALVRRSLRGRSAVRAAVARWPRVRAAAPSAVRVLARFGLLSRVQGRRVTATPPA